MPVKVLVVTIISAVILICLASIPHCAPNSASDFFPHPGSVFFVCLCVRLAPGVVMLPRTRLSSRIFPENTEIFSSAGVTAL